MSKRKYQVNDSFFDKPNVLNSYWAGFLAADGSIVKGSYNTVVLKLAHKDKDHLETFKRVVEFTGPIRDYWFPSNAGYGSSVLQVSSEQWKKKLAANFGIVPNKTFVLTPPIDLDRQCVLAFVIGFIDGDGSIFIKHDARGYKSLTLSLFGTKSMCEWFASLFDEISPAKKRAKPVVDGKSFRYMISGGRAETILKELLSVPELVGIRLERKWRIAEEWLNHEAQLCVCH